MRKLKQSWKRILKWAAIILALIFLVIQLIPINRTNPPITQEVQWDSPETRVLAQRACFDCHSNEVIWPWDGYIAPVSWFLANHIEDGKRHLNFSEWDKPNSDLEEIVKTIKNGSMPLDEYVFMHPTANLTQSEKDALVAGFTTTLQQDPPLRGRR